MFYLIITYPGSSSQHLLNCGTKAAAAKPENKDVILDMARQLLIEKIISSYQLVDTVGAEQNQTTLDNELLQFIDE